MDYISGFVFTNPKTLWPSFHWPRFFNKSIRSKRFNTVWLAFALPALFLKLECCDIITSLTIKGSMEPRMRFELTTHALRMRCSTSWATSAHVEYKNSEWLHSKGQLKKEDFQNIAKITRLRKRFKINTLCPTFGYICCIFDNRYRWGGIRRFCKV